MVLHYYEDGKLEVIIKRKGKILFQTIFPSIKDYQLYYGLPVTN